MNKTLRISFSLRNAYKVNSILYSLRQLPLIKRLLPASLYGSKGLNRFAAVLAAIWELLSAFLGKYLYFLIMLSLPLNAYQTGAKAEAFLHMLLCLSVIGSLFNTYLFNPTKEKYYAVILMRMDARQYALVDYAYNMVKLLVGFLVFGMLFGLAWGVPVWLCLLAPFFVSGLKMIAAVCQPRKISVDCGGSAACRRLRPAYTGLPAAAVVRGRRHACRRADRCGGLKENCPFPALQGLLSANSPSCSQCAGCGSCQQAHATRPDDFGGYCRDKPEKGRRIF